MPSSYCLPLCVHTLPAFRFSAIGYVVLPLQLPFNLPAEFVRVAGSPPSVTYKVMENKVRLTLFIQAAFFRFLSEAVSNTVLLI